MFGLKIVKSEDYSLMEGQLRSALDQVIIRDSEIKRLQSRIQELERDVEYFRSKVSDNAESETKPETILLTDVAEIPLTEEKKTRKPRRTVKKTEGTTTRKKIVHKNEEV